MTGGTLATSHAAGSLATTRATWARQSINGALALFDEELQAALHTRHLRDNRGRDLDAVQLVLTAPRSVWSTISTSPEG